MIVTKAPCGYLTLDIIVQYFLHATIADFCPINQVATWADWNEINARNSMGNDDDLMYIIVVLQVHDHFT